MIDLLIGPKQWQLSASPVHILSLKSIQTVGIGIPRLLARRRVNNWKLLYDICLLSPCLLPMLSATFLNYSFIAYLADWFPPPAPLEIIICINIYVEHDSALCWTHKTVWWPVSTDKTDKLKDGLKFHHWLMDTAIWLMVTSDMSWKRINHELFTTAGT